MIRVQDISGLAKAHYDTIKERLTKRINNVLQKGSCKCKKETYNVGEVCRNYLKELQDPSKLYSLITCKPEKIEDIIQNIKNTYPEFVDKKKDSNRVLYNIFVDSCYDGQDSNGKKYFDKSNFISNFDLETCPYCNRNYIYSISRNGQEVKPEIDHFYPKSQYPFLAMSYYNLIPSCPTCNGFGAKEEKDPLDAGNKIINPYLINTDDFKFSFDLQKVSAKDFVRVKLKCPSNGYNELFKLDRLYEKHNDHVEELIFKSEVKYPQSYRENVGKMFMNANSSNKYNIDFQRFLIGNYVKDDELHKRPLAKLYRDIAQQLKLI